MESIFASHCRKWRLEYAKPERVHFKLKSHKYLTLSFGWKWFNTKVEILGLCTQSLEVIFIELKSIVKKNVTVWLYAIHAHSNQKCHKCHGRFCIFLARFLWKKLWFKEKEGGGNLNVFHSPHVFVPKMPCQQKLHWIHFNGACDIEGRVACWLKAMLLEQKIPSAVWCSTYRQGIGCFSASTIQVTI